MLLKGENLSKTFGGVVAVDDFNIEIDKNEIVGLIGPNGAGKTTIFNLLSKVYDPIEGKIYLEGKDITNLSQSEIAKNGIARTFQNIRLFSGLSVLGNVKIACDYKPRYNLLEGIFMLPRKFQGERLIEAEALECLKLVGLEKLANEKPENLPYGLQRRLEIARALALKPKVIMLDEPAAGLNTEETFELIDFLKKIQSKVEISILIIEHRMDVIMQLCDRIYVQNFGKTIAVGTPEQIQINKDVLVAYLGQEDENANS